MQDFTYEYNYEYVPTIKSFANSDKKVRMIIGPIGSGKSSGCIIEIIARAMEQKPQADGVRRSRWAVIRNTYGELRNTTIRTVHDWIPPRFFGRYIETKKTYIITELPTNDGTKVELELVYMALDDEADIANLLSLELTGAWVNEVREIPRIVFDAIDSRTGRYPAMKDGGCAWSGVIADTNPPDTDHWIPALEKEIQENELVASKYEIFHQPSGLAENAENIPYLEKGYYQNVAIGKDDAWVNVYVHGNYGYLREGKVVFANYNDAYHCASSIIPATSGVPLLIGFDFGLNATAVFAQLLPTGRLVVIDEYVGEDIGIRKLLTDVVKPLLLNKYKGLPVVCTGDPAGKRRSDTDERTCYQEIKSIIGLNTLPAKTNAWLPRYMAVDSYLTRMLGDGKPAFQLSPNCEVLRRGFQSKYIRKRVAIVGKEMYRDVPEKTIESHPMDCLQYIALYCEGGVEDGRRQFTMARPNISNKVSLLGWT